MKGKAQKGCLIAGTFFKNQSQAKEYIIQILYKYQEGEFLDQADFQFVMGLISLHPRCATKIGLGVKGIYVKTNPVYKNTRGFWIVRLDGSETDFSYIKCLSAPTHQKRFVRACRVAIEPYIIAFKQKFFLDGEQKVCPILCVEIDWGHSHVDHAPPNTFQAIVERFIQEKNIDVDQVKINGEGQDNTYQDTFDDKQLEQDWINFHNLHAQLRVISATANLCLK